MRRIFTLLSLGLISATALAEGVTIIERNNQALPVQPGSWQVIVDLETDATQNRQPIEIEDTQTRYDVCVTLDDAFMKPKDLTAESCTIDNVRVTDNPRMSTQGLSFDISCDMEGVDMEGTYVLNRNESGDQVSGEVEMSGRARGGLSIDVTGEIRGRKAGRCRG